MTDFECNLATVIQELQEAVSSMRISGAAQPATDISVTSSVQTPIPLLSVIFDQGQFFTSDGKVTISKDGVYIVTGELNYASNGAAGGRWVNITKNGDLIVASGMSSYNSGGSATACTSIVVKLSAGDYLELYASQITAATLTISASRTRFSIARLSD